VKPGRVEHFRKSGRSFLASFGVLLMIVSFVWLQSISRPAISRNDTNGAANEVQSPEGPFAVVVLDPGHGGQDSGTTKAGIPEKELALDVAHRVERFLQLQGVEVLLTRGDDTYVSLAGRAAIANEQSNCVFVSIHFDDAARAAATGVETYYAAHQISNAAPAASWLPFLRRTSLELPNVQSQSLASFIQEALASHTQAVNRGTATQQFFVLANVRHPAVLIEGGFFTNAEEMGKLATGDYRQQIAAAISDGIMRYREVLQQQQTPAAGSLSSDK
jgi:N-acetylmuramoyl-L-alanine amidase